MYEVHVTKHYKKGKHVGYKKMIGGKLWHLATGTTPDDERRAKRKAEAIQKYWETIRAAGGGWTAESAAVAWAKALSADINSQSIAVPLAGANEHPLPPSGEVAPPPSASAPAAGASGRGRKEHPPTG